MAPMVRKVRRVSKARKVSKGDTGEQGPAGAGADPGAIQDIVDGVIGTGVLADIHHILLLKDGETDPKKGTVIDVAGVAVGAELTSVDVSLLAGASTTYAAKVATVSGQPIPSTFTWASDVEDVASVDDGTMHGSYKGRCEGNHGRPWNRSYVQCYCARRCQGNRSFDGRSENNSSGRCDYCYCRSL